MEIENKSYENNDQEKSNLQQQQNFIENSNNLIHPKVFDLIFFDIIRKFIFSEQMIKMLCF